jgi:hypothetical protein
MLAELDGALLASGVYTKPATEPDPPSGKNSPYSEMLGPFTSTTLS